MKFFLGTHQPQWLSRVNVPLFVSDTTLRKRRYLPAATCSWALDSGAYSMLNSGYGWQISPETYINNIRDYVKFIGNLEWAAPQDSMCEPWILRKYGAYPEDHIDDTVDNYDILANMAPDLNIIPSIQGWEIDEYLYCIDQYRSRGYDLTTYPLVGLGSICRRQHTQKIYEIVKTIHDLGIKIHGFGVKTEGFKLYGHMLASADSMKWSREGRDHPEIVATPTCRETHINCANCLPWALQWRESLNPYISMRYPE